MNFDYSKINFEHIRIVAYNCLSLFKVSKFPIRIVPLFDKFEDLILIPYTQAASAKNISVNELEEKVTHSNDAATLKRGNKFFVFYNDNTYEKTVERIRFSIIHELGHIALNHFDDEKTLLTRSALSNEKYERLEVEANFFAAEFLSPKALIPPEWKVSEIQSIFRVSEDSAIKTQHFISQNLWFQNRVYSEIIKKDYKFYSSDTLETLLPPFCTIKQAFNTSGFVFCNNCFSFTRVSPHQETIYCCVCGNQLKNKVYDKQYLFTIYDLEVRNLKNYTSIKLNDIGKAMECPNCHALQEEKGEFCDVCGVYLINRCTGNPDTGFGYNNLGEPCENGKILGGRSRYCRYCGCMSTFYQQGILPSYSDDATSTEVTTDTQPF